MRLFQSFLNLHLFPSSKILVFKFVGVPFALTKQELPYLKEHTNAYFDCKVLNSYDLGTHMMFLAEVTDADVLSDEKAMTYAYYHEFVKPKPDSSQSAPKKGWRCTVCVDDFEKI